MTDWNTTRLGDVVEILSAKRVFANDYTEIGVPFWRGKEVVELSSGKNISTKLFISEDTYQRLGFKSGFPSKGDILLTSVGTLGRTYMLTAKDRIYFKDGNLTWFRGFSENINPKWLLYWLRSSVGQALLKQSTIGSTQQALTITNLKAIEFQFPNLDAQDNCASFLTGIDDKIELNRQMNETLEAMAHAIFKDWFVDFGPVTRKMSGITNPVKILGGLITDPDKAGGLANLFPNGFGNNDLPKGWEETSLKQLIDFNPTERLKNGVEGPYIGMSALPTRGIEIEEIINRPFGSGAKFRNKDTLFARITPCLENGKTGLVHGLPAADIVAWGSTEFVVMRAKEKANWPIPYLIARSPTFRGFAEKRMTGTSGRQRVKRDVLEAYPIAAPPKKVTSAFIDLVNPMFEKMISNSSENQTLAETRDYLLPRLMSGEVRVADLDEVA